MRLILFFMIALSSMHSIAVSPEIARQQQQLQKERSLWNDVSVPYGIDSQILDPSDRRSGHDKVTLLGKNLFFSYVEDLSFDIKTLSAVLVPTKEKTPVVLNDIDTFRIEVKEGDLVLDFKALDYIFNRHVLNYAQRPLRNVKLSGHNDEIIIDTELQLKPPYPSMWIKARIKGHVNLDENKKISIDVSSFEAFKLPLAWALKLLKLDLDMFITLERPGVKLVDRSIKIDLNVLPPPKLSGDISQVKLVKNGLNLIFKSKNKILFDSPPVISNSYLWLQSGDVRIADMIILNGHLQAVSAKPEQRLLFNLYECRQQIAKGMLKITPKGEIIAYLPQKF